MTTPVKRLAGRVLLVFVPIMLAALSVGGTRSKADSIELVNGDIYSGTLVSASGADLVFQSEIQGRLTIPRDKVVRINIRQPAPPMPGLSSNAPAALKPGPSSTDPASASSAVSSGFQVGAPSGSTQFSLQYTNRLSRLTNAPARTGEAALRQLRREGANSKTVARVRAIFQGESGLRPAENRRRDSRSRPGNWTETNGADRKLSQRMWERKTEKPAKFVGFEGSRDDKVVIR